MICALVALAAWAAVSRMDDSTKAHLAVVVFVIVCLPLCVFEPREV
jgi:hypothetical protein